MKKITYKSGLVLTFALIFAFTATAQEISKEFHKQYTAGTGTTLNLSNKYGKVVVKTTETDQVKIDVVVTLDMPNRDRAEKLIEYINVEFSQSGDDIFARTVIDDRFSFTGWSGSRRFSIDYNVEMPGTINLALSNRYGNSELDEISGYVTLDIKYGDLNAEGFTRGNEKPINKISLAYGKAFIRKAGWLDIVSRYSGSFEIEKSQALLLDTRYSKMELGETSSLVAESKYDNIRIGTINNLVLNSGYSDVVVETLVKKLKFDGGYGALTVEEIPAGFESIETDSRYIGVKLGIDGDANYNLEAKLSYGDLKFDEDRFQNQRRIIQNNSTEVAGVVGNENSPAAHVKVSASYGSVRLND